MSYIEFLDDLENYSSNPLLNYQLLGNKCTLKFKSKEKLLLDEEGYWIRICDTSEDKLIDVFDCELRGLEEKDGFYEYTFFGQDYDTEQN